MDADDIDLRNTLEERAKWEANQRTIGCEEVRRQREEAFRCELIGLVAQVVCNFIRPGSCASAGVRQNRPLPVSRPGLH
jgi:hypothetical protein